MLRFPILPLLLAVAVLPASASCSPLGDDGAGRAEVMSGNGAAQRVSDALDARPGDGVDDRVALQTAVDRLATQGGGTLQLEAGTYDLAMPLYLRSGVKIVGRGPATILSGRRLNRRPQWLGTTVFAGNLTPGSFTDDRGEGYPGRPAVRAGAQSLTISDCRGEKMPAPGTVVWLSSFEGMKGRGERTRPEYGEMSLVNSVQGCQVNLADPIKVVPGEFLIHWSDGSRALPDGTEPNAPIRDAGIHNLTLEAGDGTALIPSGCYRCDFTNITMARTQRLIEIQGQRHTRFKNITGSFRSRGIEVAMYARDVLVEDVNAEVRDPEARVRPAIRIGEYARGNTVRNVRLKLGEAYVGRDKLRFDESADNRLQNIELSVPRSDQRGKYVYRPPNAARDVLNVLPPQTFLDNVRICYSAGATGCVAID